MVIKRAQWPTPPRTAGALLAALGSTPALSEKGVARLDRAQREDRAPESPRPAE